MNAASTIRIASGNYEAWISPAAGARVTKLVWQGEAGAVDCLVPCGRDEFDSHDWPSAGAFVMLPFANRLSPASFEWNGAAAVLQSPGPSGQGLHGFGHRQAWTVMQTTASSLLLSYVHQAPTDEWPWSFCAEIAYALTPSGLTVEVTIENLSLLPMPAVLGWHPFIPLPDQFDDASGSLSVIATKTYAIGSDGLGHAQISAAPLEIQTLAAMLTSAHTTAYENWSGTVQIPLRGTSDLTLSSSDAKHLLIHVPTGLQHVCIEPITALPGALQRYSDHQKKMHLSLLSNEQKKITCCLGLHTIL